MLPEASSEDLLYVTNYSNVLVFAYPQGQLVGELKNFFSNAGACVDSKGDVFIVNEHPEAVYEYAHGGTKRIATLVDKKAGSIGCSINPVTGDLAVSGVSSYVDIFKQAKGKPISVLDRRMWYGSFVTYDDTADLFFLGLKNPKGGPRLSEMLSGSKHFTNIKADAYMYDEGGIQWNAGYLTTVSYIDSTKTTAIGQFQVTGQKAHEVSVTPLETAYIVLGYFIDGETIVVPNLGNTGKNNVLLYDYPAGGEPTETITQPGFTPRGVVVSPAQ
jgi:DNA-binding beta-propeller fold protein YncE